MTLLWFDIIATLIYAASMVCLLHEFRALTPEARHERQTVPMLLAVTALYVVVCRDRRRRICIAIDKEYLHAFAL